MNRHPNLKNLTNRSKGRPKGSKNQFTNLKEAFINVFEDIGGEETLSRWAKENLTEYYKIISKFIPKEIELAGEANDFISYQELLQLETKLSDAKRREKEFEDNAVIISAEEDETQ